MFALIPETPRAPQKHSVVPLLIILALLVIGIGVWFLYSREAGFRAVVSPSRVVSQPQARAPTEEETEAVPMEPTEVYDGGLFQFTHPTALLVTKDQTGTVLVRPKTGEGFVLFMKQTEQPLAEYEITSPTSYPAIRSVSLSADAPEEVKSARGNSQDWLYEDRYAAYRITIDPSGTVRDLRVNERQIMNLLFSTLKEKSSPLVEQYFWRGTAKIPLTFYYPKALTATSTSRNVTLSSNYELMKGCTDERSPCATLGYSFAITSISNLDTVQDQCREAVSSTIPNLLRVVPKKNAPVACSSVGLHYAWVFTGKKGMYAITENRSGDVFDVPFRYAEKELLTTLKEK
jgi:hypothetical protein